MAAMPDVVDVGEMGAPDMSVDNAGFSLRSWLDNHIEIIKPAGPQPLLAITYRSDQRQLKQVAAKIGANGVGVEFTAELERVGTTVPARDILEDICTAIAVEGPTRLSLREFTTDMQPTDRWYCLFKLVKPGRKYEVRGRPAGLAALAATEQPEP